MQQRHLLPNEIDLLLDGEVGFGVAPLRAHVDDCPACRARLSDARAVVEALEDLPHFAPRVHFADRVLAQVQVIEPWYAAALDAARRLVPQSVPMRVVTGATTAVVATAVSLGAIWLALRADAALYVLGLVADRGRAALVDAAGALIGNTLGQPGLDALRSGSVGGLALGAGFILVAVGGATFGFRAFASASRRVRE